MPTDTLIFVVDDDPAVCASLRALLESARFKVRDYGSAETFLSEQPSPGACLIADISMPGMDGLTLQEKVVERGLELPIIMITGHGDISLAVRAMKAGAVDFIEKPFSEEAIIRSISRAIAGGRTARDINHETTAAQHILAHLTPRERMVLEQIVAGRSNKVAAYELGISPRTIEIHRAHIMNKMKAHSLADLVRVALAADRPLSGFS